MSDHASPSSAPLTALPLFPLATVLLPGALLPLQLFELRYLKMIGECERTGQGFGVVCLTQGTEVHRPGQAAAQFAPVGTWVHIELLERPQAGLVRVWCRGGPRFQIHATEQRADGLWLGSVQSWPTEPALAIPNHLQYLSTQLELALRSLNAPDSPVAHWPRPWALQDCGWVANRWCELLPLPLDMKYRLFSLQEPLIRLELVGDVVESNTSTDPETWPDIRPDDGPATSS